MSPAELAMRECANWINGICLGVTINKDLSQWFDLNLAGKPCCVSCMRCPYFESVIIPLVRTNTKHPHHIAMTNAVRKYEKKYYGKKLDRHCKECKKPSPGMKKNQKFCPTCAQKRKLRSSRESKRLKRRKSG